MWITLAFWSLLSLPGLALMQRFDPESLRGGLPSIIARAYIASFALLTPLSVLGYVLHLPIALFAGGYLLLVAGGGWMLWRRRRRVPASGRERGGRRRFTAEGGIALLVLAWLAFDLWLGVRVGTHVQGDARFHIARVRMLLEVGMGSWDPLVEGLQFEPVYHTNLYHALIASSALLCRLDAGAAWIGVWPFAKLLTAACGYELALCVLGERRYAWIAALAVSAWLITQSTLPLPNTLAPFGLLTFGLAAGICALRAQADLRAAAWLGAASLALAQTHMLYALFLALLLAPLTCLLLIHAVLRKRPVRATLACALVAQLACAPWLLVPALPRLQEFAGSVAHAQAKRLKEDMFVDAGDGQRHMKPGDFLYAESPIVALLALLVALAGLTRRREPLVVLSILLGVGVYLFVPAVCTALIRLLEAPWILVRLAAVLDALCYVLLPAGATCAVTSVCELLLQRVPSAAPVRESGRTVLGLAGCALALGYAYAYAPRPEPWTAQATWLAAHEDRAAQTASEIARRARFFAAHIPERAAVMAPVQLDYYVPMHCNCFTLAFRPGRGGRHVPDIAERRAATDRFYAHDTTPEARSELIRRFRLRYVYSSPRRARLLERELTAHGARASFEGQDALIELASPDGP